MNKVIRKWASESLNAGLSSIREQGESKTVDFKEVLPEQAYRLGREVAAIVSSGGGRILIGVDDNGDLLICISGKEDFSGQSQETDSGFGNGRVV